MKTEKSALIGQRDTRGRDYGKIRVPRERVSVRQSSASHMSRSKLAWRHFAGSFLRDYAT